MWMSLKKNHRLPVPIVTFAFAASAYVWPLHSTAAISFKEVNGPFAEAEAWGSSWGDLNNDRCPDLFVNHHRDKAGLYKNNCDGTFKDITERADKDRAWLNDNGVDYQVDIGNPTSKSGAVPDNHLADQHGAAWADIDGDGDQDIYVTTGANWDGQLLINEGGVLRYRSAAAAFKDDKEGRMPMWFDYDNNHTLDLIMQSRTKSWSLERDERSGIFSDSDSITGFKLEGNGVAINAGILIDLDDNSSPEYLGLPEGTFPQVAFDMSSLPFRNITGKIPKVPQVIDHAVADFNGDLRNDILLVRGRIRRSGAVLFGSRLIETWLTASAGNDNKSIRFKSTGNVQSDMYSLLGLTKYHIGASGYQPGENSRINSNNFRFNLDANNQLNHGIKPHQNSKPEDAGIYIGYNPSTQEWQIQLANGGVYTPAYFVVNSSAAISNLQVEGVGAVDKPIAPVLLTNTGNGFNGNASPLAVASNLGDLGTAVTCNGVAAGDFDNDMDQDVYMACSGGVENIANILYENTGNGRFVKVAGAGGAQGPVGSSVTDGKAIADNVTVADYDGDGKLDMFVTNGVQLFPVRFDAPDNLYRNTTQNNNHWIELDLSGVRSNTDAIGAKVYATAGGKTQLREQNHGQHRWAQNHQRIHFGLAANTTVDLRIEWPSGQVDTYDGVRADRLYTAIEKQSLKVTPLGPVAADPGGSSNGGGGGSTGGNLTVQKAIYFSAEQQLWIRASSSAVPEGSAVIEAAMVKGSTRTPLGQLSWKPEIGQYQQRFKTISVVPDSVVITTSSGGKATMEVEVQ